MNKRFIDYLVGVPLVKVLSLFKEKSSPTALPAAPKILVIKLAAMGDTILMMPVLKSLRKAYPDSQIHWLISGVNAALATTVSSVDKFHLWNPVSPVTFPAVLKQLKAEKFDVVIDAEQWSRATALLSYLIGAPRRIGFDAPAQHRAAMFTDPVLKKSDQHEISEFYDLFSALTPLQKNLELELTETERGRDEIERWKDQLEKGEGPLVILHPGCGADGLPREWPLADYALLGHWLLTHHHARLVLTGGPEEKKKTRNLNQLLNQKALDLGGELSWLGTVSLIKQSDVLVSGNTGVMHIAAALKKPQIALHGPTNPTLWGPLNPNARVVQTTCPQCPCLSLGFEYHTNDQSCMAKIELSEVKKAFSGLFDNK